MLFVHLQVGELIVVHKFTDTNLSPQRINTGHSHNLHMVNNAIPTSAVMTQCEKFTVCLPFFPNLIAMTTGEEDISEFPNSISSNCWKFPGDACREQ